MKVFHSILLGSLLWTAVCAASDERPAEGRALARTVLALYDGQDERVRWTHAHTLAEMPLNYLGLRVRYHDIRRPLPRVEELGGVRGVLMWVRNDSMPDPEAFLEWADALLARQVRFVFIGDFPFQNDRQGGAVRTQRVDRFLEKLGIRHFENWSNVTYDVKFVHRDAPMLGYERELSGVLPSFTRVRAVHPQAQVYLTARRGGDPDTDADLIFTTPRGGYVAGGYAHFEDATRQHRFWYIDPFLFLRRAFDTDGLPKPDPSTLSGRRVFYSHIDGDGWRNRSEVPRYKKRRALAAEVILQEVIRRYPDLPVTVAPIAGDLDPEWFGSSETQGIAREIFSLPQVEAGSHTYSHPFQWDFFEDARPDKERPYLNRYRRHWGQSAAGRLLGSLLGPLERNEERPAPDSHLEDYHTPRAYAVRPFDLELEIEGAARYIEKFLPPGKRVKVVQWSGDTLPFPQALARVRQAGLLNINGGDTRFDRDFPSYAWVAPIGRMGQGGLQVYASNSNENTYTDLWTDRYFGFVHLVRTFRNTERPRRLKPLNVYYHMYSGEKLSSLNALLANLNYVREKEIAPVTASRYASMAEGFHSLRLISAGPLTWRVEERGRLQTLRFDQATYLCLDLTRSRGVLGQRHLYGSLYAALDPAVPRPLVALRQRGRSWGAPRAQRPYLLQGRWRFSGLQASHQGLGFSVQAEGFGKGDMSWVMPRNGLYRYRVSRHGQVLTAGQALSDRQGTLNLSLSPNAHQPLLLQVWPAEDPAPSGPSTGASASPESGRNLKVTPQTGSEAGS